MALDQSLAGRVGPSHGLQDQMLPVMLDHTIRTFFPDIWQARAGDTLQARSRMLPASTTTSRRLPTSCCSSLL